MKRKLLSVLLSVSMLPACAESYDYLTFVTTDGAKASVPAASLSLSVSGNMLSAGSQSFAISNLLKMYFSTTDETTATSIGIVADTGMDEITDVFDLQGKRVAKDQMQNGTYIIKTSQGTFRIMVK